MLIGLLVAPAPAAAVDPIPGTPLPAEPEAIVLPFVTDAIAFDLDADGTRDLVVVTSSSDDPGLAALRTWYVDDLALGVSAAGHGSAVPLRRPASGDALMTEAGRSGIDREGMIPVHLDEPARLLRAHRDGREILLLAIMGGDTQFDLPCCLTIWEVVDKDRTLELRLVADTERLAVEVVAADMDADGTDELLVTEGPLNDLSQVLDLALLRWNGERFARTAFTIPSVTGCCGTILDIGDSDGFPGEEVLLAGPLIGPGRSQPTGLHRVSLRAGAPFVERGDLGDVIAAHALSLETGPAVLTTDGSILFLWSWPRDGQPDRQAARTSGGAPSAVFGTGAHTRIVAGVAFQDPGSVLVLPGDLGGGAGPSTAFGRDTRPVAFAATVQGEVATSLTPFIGVIPGGLPGDRDVYVFGGQLVRPVPDPDVLAEVTSLALLPGLEPVGTVGPGGEWVALLTDFSEFARLNAGPPEVTLLAARNPSALRLVATSSVLEPESDGGHLAPTFLGVATDPDHPTGLIVGDEAAYAEISGPPGTTVWWATRGRPSGNLTLGADGVARIQLLEAAGPNAPDGSGATASIWLVTPAGHAYYGTWRIRVYRQPPSLVITPNEALFNFSPAVVGQTVPGATVTIDGTEVRVEQDGSFAGPVSAGLLPSDVRVVAVDPVGNRTERVVSVIWPVDYRRLPFVPMAVLLTVGAAAVLFLRRPDTGPSRRTPDDGATFEEIGG
ncbi:MAG: hypothetical protein WEE67_02235 [Chloroflexota bacterium]